LAHLRALLRLRLRDIHEYSLSPSNSHRTHTCTQILPSFHPQPAEIVPSFGSQFRHPMGHPPIANTVGNRADLKTKVINDQLHYRNEKTAGRSTVTASYFKTGFWLLCWIQELFCYGPSRRSGHSRNVQEEMCHCKT
jgi:hypothetical protein